MTENFEARSAWCLVANVIAERPYGTSGEMQLGTKHFSPNTKVYCSKPLWGDGYEQIVVLARHRGSRRMVQMVLPAKALTNWRAKRVYIPKNLPAGYGFAFWSSKEEVERRANAMRHCEEARKAKRQELEHPKN